MTPETQDSVTTLFPTLAQILAAITERFDFTTAETISQLLHSKLDGIKETATYHPFTPAGQVRVVSWRTERHGA